MTAELSDVGLAYDIIEKAAHTGPAILRHAASMPSQARPLFLTNAAKHLLSFHDQAAAYVRLPIDVQTFIESPEFLACGEAIYPAVMDVLCEINSGRYVEAVLTGAIGTGKTTIALLTTAYQLHVLSGLRDPHALFKLDPASEIVLAIQSLSARVARDIAYTRLREMIDRSPYFQHHFRPDRKIKSALVFPGNIIVRPLSSKTTAAIGANIIGGILDEVNYMETVERSRRSPDGGVYDQALEMYNSLVRRRKSRFMSCGGKLPGMLCLVSSKRYPGEFTDVKQAEARREIHETGSTSIYVYDRRLWEIKPEGTFGEARFQLFLGDNSRKPCILEAGAETAEDDKHLVVEVPQEFRSEFQRDMLSAIRDIAGSATFAIHPFILNTESVSAAFGRCESVLNMQSADFKTARPHLYINRIREPQEPRFAHVDLGLTGDSAGVAVGWVSEFVKVPRGENTLDPMPRIVFDFILEVKPPRGGEIHFENIRNMFIKLKECGMNLKWISYDSYQSTDSVQLLRHKGFETGTVSIDKTSVPYDVMRTAFYDGRVEAPVHEKALEEIIRLERDPRTGLINHAPRFSKDCADAVAGVIYGLTYRRAVWARHNEPTRGAIANAIRKLNPILKAANAE
jgi:hypothetical protein